MRDCPHGDDAALCPPCLNARPEARARHGNLRQSGPPGRPIAARYSGWCPDCGDLIEPGDVVVPVPVRIEGEDFAQWRHDYCVDG